MSSGWTSFKSRFGKKSQDSFPGIPGQEGVPRPWRATGAGRRPGEQPTLARPNGKLDTVGQKNELIRVRFANLIDRLEEIRSLKDDFTLLSEPVYDLIRSYPQIQSRLLETEAVLRQETDTTGRAPARIRRSREFHARMTDDFSATVSQLRKAEAKLREQESAIEDLRLSVKDKEAVGVDLENQLSIETERARNITEENQALRLEAQEADQTVARAERELIETRERNGCSTTRSSASRRWPRNRITGCRTSPTATAKWKPSSRLRASGPPSSRPS